MRQSIFDVRKYGATGDGATKETAVLQQAIDDCHEAGGGVVRIGAGTYICGTLYLKSNVELHLEAGAVLRGSAHADDYNDEDIFPENQAFPENVTARHLIIAYRQENIAITGSGIIDGNSSQFFGLLPEGIDATYRHKNGNFPINEWRPGQMIFLCRCTQVAVRDVKLLNSPYWTLFLLGCNDVQIRGLLIENPPATANGDGIDVDGCRNVTISDCIIRSDDDCIAVRANKRFLGDAAQPCENVAVSNCILSTPCNAIRIGVGDGEVRHCLFNNIVVPEASRGISIVSLYRKMPMLQHGTCIENVHFSNFILNADVPLTVGAGHEAAPPAAIRDISFHRFRITAWAAAQIAGTPQIAVERVRLNDFEWLVHGGSENLAYRNELPHPLSHHGYRGRNGEPALPCALYGVDIHGILVENLRIHWKSVSAVWRDGILMDRVRDMELYRATLRQPHCSDDAAIHCRECSNVTLRHCSAQKATLCFLQMESSLADAEIYSFGNDWRTAACPIESDVRVIE